jgi:hypothetical protein
MIFGGRRHADESGSPHVTAVVRDIVEVLAVIAAGAWAFYVFVYENRIKPSFEQPEINISAAMQQLNERNGLIGVGLRIQFHNVGSVKANFLGFAANVYGQQVIPAKPVTQPENANLTYEYRGFYRLRSPIPVYTWAYVTKSGNPATGVETILDPGTTIENYRAFYVPKGQFDLLTVAIDAPYLKSDARQPARLGIRPGGSAKIVTEMTPELQQYNIDPVTSLVLH